MAFACTRCGGRADQLVRYCVRCGGYDSFVAVVRGPGDGVLGDTAVVSAATLYKRQGTFWKLSQEWTEVLGRLPRSPFVLAIHGPPGAGKTTTTVRLASHLCEIGAGPVLVDQLEEGTGAAFVDVLRRLEVAREDLLVTCTASLVQLLQAVEEHEPHVVVLDSLSMTTLSAEDLARIVRETSCSLVFTLQETKGGEARGSLALLHVADIVLRLDPGGPFVLEKSRYSARKEGVLPWQIASIA